MAYSSPSSSRAWPRPATLPWPKMPQTPAMKRLLDAIALDVLLRHEADDGLPDGQPDGTHSDAPLSAGPTPVQSITTLLAGVRPDKTRSAAARSAPPTPPRGGSDAGVSDRAVLSIGHHPKACQRRIRAQAVAGTTARPAVRRRRLPGCPFPVGHASDVVVATPGSPCIGPPGITDHPERVAR